MHFTKVTMKFNNLIIAYIHFKIKSKKWFVTLADWERVLVLSLLMGSLLTFNWIIHLRIIYHNWIITTTRSTPYQTSVVSVSVP